MRTEYLICSSAKAERFHETSSCAAPMKNSSVCSRIDPGIAMPLHPSTTGLAPCVTQAVSKQTAQNTLQRLMSASKELMDIAASLCHWSVGLSFTSTLPNCWNWHYFHLALYRHCLLSRLATTLYVSLPFMHIYVFLAGAVGGAARSSGGSGCQRMSPEPLQVAGSQRAWSSGMRNVSSGISPLTTTRSQWMSNHFAPSKKMRTR